MRPITLSLYAAVLSFVIVGCSKAPSTQPAEAGKPLNLFIWSEYVAPDLLPGFEKRTGIKVHLTEYDATEDMIAKLHQAGGTEQYDVVVAPDHAVDQMAKLGLIRPLDAARIPNAKNVAERFRDPRYDPGGKYSLPYQWGTVGLIYRKDKVPNLEPTWAVLFEPDKQPGPFILMDSMRDLLAAALRYQGKSINTRRPEDLKAAGELLLRAKKSPKFVGFEGGVGGKNKVASGDAVVAMSYNGDAIQAIAEDENLGFVVPREGTVIWVDAMTITSHAPNPDGAYAFINYVLDGEVGARLSNFKRYATPNAAALPLIKPEDRANKAIYPHEDLIGKMEYIEDVANDTRLYDEVWTAVKSR